MDFLKEKSSGMMSINCKALWEESGKCDGGGGGNRDNRCGVGQRHYNTGVNPGQGQVPESLGNHKQQNQYLLFAFSL